MSRVEEYFLLEKNPQLIRLVDFIPLVPIEFKNNGLNAEFVRSPFLSFRDHRTVADKLLYSLYYAKS